MLGQLEDAGNTTTLAHHLDLLAGAGTVRGLPKYAGDVARQRGSSPRLQVLNTALMTATSGLSLAGARADREFWGRLVESAVGAPLAHAGTAAFAQAFKVHRTLLVGGDGVSVEEFLSRPVSHWTGP